jgi:iron complex transport system permease protein
VVAGTTLAAVVLANGVVGAAAVPPGAVFAALLAPLGLASPPDAMSEAILWSVRFPRIGLGLLVGAALAVGGALMQGVFRNPLAEPGILGVSNGAALGAATVQVFGAGLLPALPELLRPWALAAAAFLGALGASTAVAWLGRRAAGAGEGLLLAGIAVNAGAGSLLALLLWVADDAALRGITAWMMGSLGGATGPVTLGVTPLILTAVALAVGMHRSLDALLLGEAGARHLGMDPRRVRRVALVACSVMVGAAVAVSGAIGFVGLIVPQLVRLAVGARHRVVLLGSLLLGPTLLLGADLLSRTLAAPAEIPIGVITSVLGTPVFGALLLRRSR